MRALLVVMVGLLAPAAAAAGPWLFGEDAALPATDEVIGLSLRADGRGFAVSAGGGVMRIFEVTHTLTDGPTLTLVDDPAITTAPRMAFDGTWVIASGLANGNLRRGSLAGVFTSLPSNWISGTVRALALDRGGSGTALLSFDNAAIGANASRSADSFGTYVDQQIGASSDGITALAVQGDRGFAVVAAGIYTSSAVAAGTWNLVAPLVGGPVSGASLASVNSDGAFLTAGTAGMAVLVPPTLDATEDCGDGGADITAIDALETDFWLGRADGTLDVVNVASGCPWSVLEPHTTGLISVDSIAARDARLALALGQGPAGAGLSWRNRPPLAPSTTGGGDVDEGAALTLTAQADDPDVSFDASDANTYSWICDPELSASGLTGPTVTASAPASCVDADTPGARKTYACTVTTTDTDAQQSPSVTITYNVLPIDTVDPTVLGVQGLQDGAAVLAGTVVTLTADATDDDDACLYQADWALFDSATDTLRDQRLDQAWNAPFTFTANTLAGETFTDYYLGLAITDTAGNSGALSSFTFRVGLPQPPLDVALSCPATIEAGTLGTATAIPSRTSGTVVDYTWVVGGATVADAEPTDEAFTFQTDVCDGGEAVVVRMMPHGIFEEGERKSCTIALAEPATPPAPVLTIAEAPELAVTLDEAGAAVALHPAVLACADDDVLVRWELAALPAALRPAGVDAAGVLVLDRDTPLELTAGPEHFAELQGTASVVRAEAVNLTTSMRSSPVEVTLRFAADATLIARAGLEAHLYAAPSHAIEEGELVEVAGTLAIDLPFALPQLSVTLAGDGLSPVPGTVVVKSACAASAATTHQGTSARVTLEGVSSSCPAQLRFLARRDLGAGSLSVRACAWGEAQTPLARCDGGLALNAAPAFACANGSSPPLAFALLLLVLGAFRTSVRSPVRRIDAPVRRIDAP